MFSLLLSLLGCKKQTMPKYPEYRWNVSESAPKEYPVQIIDGDFEALDGYHKGIPTRVDLYDGWGDGRSQMATGRDEMPVPKSMAVTWYSYREDTFYRGEFKLPADKIDKLLERSRRPRPFTGIVSEGASFIVGLAPEGFVVVWFQGRGLGQVVLTDYAKPVTDVPEEVIFDYPDMNKEQVREKIIQSSLDQAEGSPNINNPKYWQQLHSELYSYDYVIESPYAVYDASISLFDKTRDFFYGNELVEFGQQKRSVPTALTVSFLFPDRYSIASVSLRDPDELYAAFRHLSKFNDAGRLRFVVKVDGDLFRWKHQVHLRVENDKESIEIKNFEFSRHGGSDLKKDLEHNKHMHQFINQPVKAESP
jgi:hypothetical protein